jgi:cation diffusion facilitator family transporter
MSRRARNTRAVTRVVWITMALNLVNALLKLTVGALSGNLTVISDSVHGFLDASNNVVGLIALKASWRPPDENHPYGHRKYEALASLAIGGLMTLTSWEILRAVIARLSRDAELPAHRGQLAWLWIAMVLAGLAINVAISIYEARRGRRLRSQFLLADAAHTRVDVFVTALAIASLLLAPRWPWLDGLLSLVIVGFILRTGWSVIRDNALLLTDAARLDPEPIRQIVESVENVQNCHAIRTHGMPDEVHLDLHIVVAPDLTAHAANVIEMRVREALQRNFPEIREVAIHHQTRLPQSAKPLSMQE